MADTNWSNAGNWDTGLVPSGIADDAIIGLPSPTTLNIDVNLNSLTVGADGILNFNSSRNLNFGGTAATSLTNMGTINVANNGDFQFQSMVVNAGVINVENFGNVTSLEVDGAAVLSGGGTINLFGSSNNSRIDGINTAMLTIVDQTIQGHGQLGNNSVGMVNQTGGTIIANTTAISNGTFSTEADINCDGAVNLLDVGPFVNIIAG